MDVAGEEHDVADVAGAQEVDQAVAVGVVAVPLVGVEDRAVGRQAEELGQGGQQPGGQGADVQAGDHHRVADQAPAGGGGGQAALEPVHLGLAGDGPGRVVDGAAGGLLRPVRAQVQHGQFGQVAEAYAPVDVPVVGQPDRHPLAVGAVRGGGPRGVGALGGRVVVLGAAGPGVVGHLVVVPGDHPRHQGVQGLEVGVGLVLGVPDPVVGQGEDLVRGLGRADRVAPVGELAGAVLVDVVAEVHDETDVVALGQVPVRAEVAGLPVAARDHPEPQVVHDGVAGRRSHGPADRGGGGAEAEPVPVAGGRAQPADVDLDGVVALRPGADRAAGDDRRERGIGGDLPGDADGRAGTRAGLGLGGGRDPGPQQDPVG